MSPSRSSFKENFLSQITDIANIVSNKNTNLKTRLYKIIHYTWITENTLWQNTEMRQNNEKLPTTSELHNICFVKTTK